MDFTSPTSSCLVIKEEISKLISIFHSVHVILKFHLELGDPDLNDIHLIEWDFNPQTDPDVKIFEENGICLTEKPWIKDPNGNPTDPPVVRKPIYSLRQQDHLRRYRPGRRTYFPQNYAV